MTYEELLEKAREIYESEDTPHFFKAWLLANIIGPADESEDERIKREIIAYINELADLKNEKIPTKWLTWLKKQGSEPNWCHHKVDLSNCSLEYRKAFYDGWNNCNQQHEQVKQQLFDKDKLANEFLRNVALSIINWLDANTLKDKMCLSNMECEDIENAVCNADWMRIYHYMQKKLEDSLMLNADNVIDWLDYNICNAYDYDGNDISSTLKSKFKEDFKL